ncbi:conserved hypothetical protein, membrane [Candidatus Magnetomorum sp. HK-1]|nr:conserved hypothetical protein, membrane [Candidatus Magnetomorum sp. HK-1]
MYYRKIVFTLLLIISGGAIYLNTIHSPFVFDDIDCIVNEKNIRIKALTFEELKIAATESYYSKTHFRPVVMTSFALNYYFDGYHPRTYHIINILIHLLAGISLFFFIQFTLRLSYNISSTSSALIDLQNKNHLDTISFFSTLIWLVNPLQVQAVTYITQRMTSMIGLFFILSLLCYARGRLIIQTSDKDNAFRFKAYLYFILCGFTAFLSIGSKETAAMLPFFIFLYEWYFFQNLSRKWLIRCFPIIIALFVIIIIAFYILVDSNVFSAFSYCYERRDFTMSERLLTELRVMLFYINLFVFPHPSRLTLEHDFPLSYSLFDPFSTFVSLLIIIGALLIACLSARRYRILSFCILWYFGNLAIESTFLWLEIIYEYRMYLPTMLICLPCLIIWFQLIQNKWYQIIPLCFIVLLYANWTFTYNKVWQDDVTLYKDCITKSPNKARPYNNLGHALTSVGKLEEAAKYLYKGVEKQWHYPVAHYNLAVVLGKLGKNDSAINHFKEAIRLYPTPPIMCNYNFGIALSKKGLTKQAMIQFRKVLKKNPDMYQVHFKLAMLYKKTNQLKRSFHHLNESLRIKPNFKLALKELGIILKQKGKIDDAINCFNQILDISPNDYDIHYNLGNLLARQGKMQQAVIHYRKALKYKHDFKEAHNNLGIIFHSQGDLDKAMHHFKAALQIDPNFSVALKNLNIAKTKRHKHMNKK